MSTAPASQTIIAPKRFLITPALIGINAAVFLWMAIAGASPVAPQPLDIIRYGGNFGPYTFTGQYWRLLTSTYVHIGIVHIALNMWCLWGLGRLAEIFYRPIDFILLYTFTGIAGSLLSSGLKPVGVSAGASGAIFGIAGVMLTTLKFGDLPLPKESRNAMLGGVARFAGINLFYGLVAAPIDNSGHVGGLLSGLLVGALMGRHLSQTDDDLSFRRFVWMALWAGLAIATYLVVRHWQPEMQRLLQEP